MSYQNYRAFHGTLAAAVPSILNEGLTSRLRELYIAGGKIDDRVQIPRTSYKAPFSEYAQDRSRDGQSWRNSAYADLELDPNVLKDSNRHPYLEGQYKYQPQDPLDEWREEKIIKRTIAPQEIKRVHINNLLSLPEVYQDVVSQKTRSLNIPLSYNILDNNIDAALKASSMFEVKGQTSNNFRDAYQYSKETNSPLVGIYGKYRKNVLPNTLLSYESELDRFAKSLGANGRRGGANVRRMAMIDPELDGFSPDYWGDISELATDKVRRMARGSFGV